MQYNKTQNKSDKPIPIQTKKKKTKTTKKNKTTQKNE